MSFSKNSNNKYLFVREIFHTIGGDTLIKTHWDYPYYTTSTFFIKSDLLGLLGKETKDATYRRLLFFDNKQKHLFGFRGIPSIEGYENGKEVLHYDTTYVRFQTLRLYDTIVNSRSERRLRYKAVEFETFYEEEIDNQYELMWRDGLDFNTIPLSEIPDSVKRRFPN